MPNCFVNSCDHRSDRNDCRFFKFPEKEKGAWEELCRTAERPVTDGDRICSCHFEDQDESNGPTKLTLPQEKSDEDTIIAELMLKLAVGESRPFSIPDMKDEPHVMLAYTSLNFQVFHLLVKTIERFAPFNYYDGWPVTKFSTQDQMLITLMKLKLNLLDNDLAKQFRTDETTVSNIVKTFIVALHELLFVGMLEDCDIPSLAKCQASMPQCVKSFPTTRLIMDVTEIEVAIPQNRASFKGMISCAPNGAIVHMTGLYPHSTTHDEIVEHCKVLEKCQPGDSILVDKSFTIQRLLPRGVNLTIPPVLSPKSDATKQEIELCEKITAARIPVKKAIARLKMFRILHLIPADLHTLSTKIYQVCCCLVNFQKPVMPEVAMC